MIRIQNDAYRVKQHFTYMSTLRDFSCRTALVPIGKWIAIGRATPDWNQTVEWVVWQSNKRGGRSDFAR